MFVVSPHANAAGEGVRVLFTRNSKLCTGGVYGQEVSSTRDFAHRPCTMGK